MASNERELVTKIDALLRKRYGNATTAAQRQLFDSFDKDRDAKIDSGELSDLLKAADVGNAFTRGAWVRGIMKSMDSNTDGRVSWDEYLSAIRAAQRRS